MTANEPGPGPGPTVLLVEDDPRIASFVTRALGALGFAVEWVATGGEGLARLDAGDVAVLVLDLGLPDIDGLDVLRTSRERGHGVPAIVVTARTDARAAALELGAVGYLRKPFPLGELLAAVRDSAGIDVSPKG